MAERAFARGGILALGAALAFGGTTPLVQRFGRGLGPFSTASLLYVGSALFVALPAASREARPRSIQRRDGPRLLLVTALGAVVAPIALAWGLQRTSGVVASLLLNLEALFTVLLARLLWHERMGARVVASLVATLAAGTLLVWDGRATSVEAGWGSLAIVGATLAWASDGVVGRPLSERDPSQVVLVKGTLGGAASLALALRFRESLPSVASAAALIACGAVGYGASLRLYLRAQRAVGAARTGTIFAAAPFIGASVAWAMGERAGGAGTIAAALLCAGGVVLQLTEHHHLHAHDALEHEHPHRHDDGHHEHVHVESVAGVHSHAHRHDRIEHEHPHRPGGHHRHDPGG